MTTATRMGADRAHEFGVGMSQTEIRALNRRVLARLGDDLELMLAQAARRCVQQVFTEALPAVWLRRAEQFEAVGSTSADESAKTCRRHAWLLAEGLPHEVAAELDDFLAGEVIR